MNLDDQFKLDHLLLKERKCRTCHLTKNLLEDYYLIRRVRGDLPSSYSYECKECTICRVLNARKADRLSQYYYPDW
jgi:DNA-directed RNA polymerase subunit M/transcription elongation factor TFIIS